MAFSAQETQFYDGLFKLIDKDDTGLLPGSNALPFLLSSSLPQQTLGEIWALADSSNNGFLTPSEWRNACRLIGYAQAGQQVEESLLNKSGGPLAKFQGHNPPAVASGGLPSINTGSGTSRFPPLTPQDRAKFTRIFVGCGPSNGLVTGDKARDIFVKSELGYAKLGQVWNLADTQQRGSLDLPDFIIGLYYIQSLKGDPSLELPATLPPGVYEQASGGRPMPPRMPASPASPLQAQRTGQLHPQTTGPRATPPRSFGTPTRQSSMMQQQQQWDVTPDAKRISDGFFAGLDKENKGYIEGEVAVPFMLQSQLDEGTLATVWDLADIRKEGKLTKDEFAVAVHLINTKLAGKDLPEKLPTSLIPPSLRGAQEMLASPTQPAGQSSAARDLFDLMGDDESTPAPAQQSLSPTPTGQGFGSSFAAQPLTQNLTGQGFGSNFSQQPLSQTPTGQRGFTSAMSPNATGQGFTSSFAPPPQQPMSRNVTGQQTPSQFIQPSQSPVATTSGFGMANFMPVRSPPPGDLLGDEGDSSALNAAAEIGNKQNELANTTRSNTELESKREALERAKADSDAQLRDLETKLSEARKKHESETKLVADLTTRTNEQSETLKQLQKDVISAESELSALKSEKDEIGQALLRDKEEVRGMQKRMSELGEETKTLKAELERLRKEARQQKGMVTIGKKQLATAESTRDTVQHDIANVHNEAIDEPAPAATESFTPFSPSLTQASAVPLPGTPERALSPANTGKSNNPFDRFGFKPVAPASQARSPSTDDVHEEQTSPGLAKAALLGAGGLLGAAAVGAGTLIASAADAITGHEEPKNDEGEEQSKAEQPEAEADPFGAPTVPAPIDRSLAATPADPFGAVAGPAAPAAPESAVDPEPAASPEEDPFGMPSFSPPPPGPAASAFEANFDDSFDAPSPPTVTEGAPVVPPTEDMHLAPASEPAPIVAASSAPVDDADFDADFAEFDEARSGADVVQPAPIHAAAPQILSSLPADLRPEAPERTISTQALPPSSKPQTPVSEAFPETDSFASSPPRAAETMPERQDETPVAAPRALEDESSDEEEGPEDLEAPKGYDKGKGKAVDQDFDSAPLDEPEHAPLAPPLALEETQGAAAVLPASKTRREAPPPPTSRGGSLPPAAVAPVSLPTHDEPTQNSVEPTAEDNSDDPFGSSFASLPPGAAPAQVQTRSAAPATGDFDNDDDFDFGDLPPAQVSNTAVVQDTKGTGDFDDEFSGFDDEFSKPGFEMVPSAQQSAPASNPSPQAPSSGFDSNMDEWGMGSTPAVSAQGAGQPQNGNGSGFSFDDTFDSNFTAAPTTGAQPPAASTGEEIFAPPPGPPPSHLAKPNLPPRQPSTAQPDDVEDVKKLCAMGFPRGLVIDALGANGYDFQKTLNVLLTD